LEGKSLGSWGCREFMYINFRSFSLITPPPGHLITPLLRAFIRNLAMKACLSYYNKRDFVLVFTEV